MIMGIPYIDYFERNRKYYVMIHVIHVIISRHSLIILDMKKNLFGTYLYDVGLNLLRRVIV